MNKPFNHTTTQPHATQAPLRAAILRTAGIVALGGMLAFAALSATACRTTEGIGRDVEALGDNVADSADKNKPK